MTAKKDTYRIKLPVEPKMKVLRGGLNRIVFANSVPFRLDIFDNDKIDPERTNRKLTFAHTVSQLNAFSLESVRVVELDLIRPAHRPLDVFHLNYFWSNPKDLPIPRKEIRCESWRVFFPGISFNSEEFPGYEFVPFMNISQQHLSIGYGTVDIMVPKPHHRIALI